MKLKYLPLLIFSMVLFVSCKEEGKQEDKLIAENRAETEKLSEAELLDTVQKQTLKYFWDFLMCESISVFLLFHVLASSEQL